MPSMPPAVITLPHPDATRHPLSEPDHPRSPSDLAPVPPQVMVTVAVTLTGEDAISAADDIEDSLWNLTTGLPDGASVVNVATTVASVRSREHVPAVPTTPCPATGSSREMGSGPVAAPPRPVAAPLKLYPAARIATLDDAPVQLTRREFDMLLHLARHPGQVFTRQQLSLAVWQEDFMRGERTIDVHIHRLRLKLGECGPAISTVRGVGYRLDAGHRVWVAPGGEG